MNNPQPLGFDTSVAVDGGTQVMTISQIQRHGDDWAEVHEVHVNLELAQAIALSAHINEWLKRRAGA